METADDDATKYGKDYFTSHKPRGTCETVGADAVGGRWPSASAGKKCVFPFNAPLFGLRDVNGCIDNMDDAFWCPTKVYMCVCVCVCVCMYRVFHKD